MEIKADTYYYIISVSTGYNGVISHCFVFFLGIIFVLKLLLPITKAEQKYMPLKPTKYVPM